MARKLLGTVPSVADSSNQEAPTSWITTALNLKADKTFLSASLPLSYNNGTGAFTIAQANTSTNGYISSTDWNTFNNKAVDSSVLHLAGSSEAITIEKSILTGWILGPARASILNPENGPNLLIYAAIAAGKANYFDEEFVVGINSINVYNGGTGNITITRNADASAPNKSGYSLTIAYDGTGTPSPGLGGFYQTFTARRNATFIQRFRAKIPVGYNVTIAENSQGTNKDSYWLTPTAGTGKWEEYIRVSHCGNTGTFATSGHVYLTGSAGAVTWYLASCNSYEINTSGTIGINDAQIADLTFSKITSKPTTLAGYGITDGQTALGYTPLKNVTDTFTGTLTLSGSFNNASAFKFFNGANAQELYGLKLRMGNTFATLDSTDPGNGGAYFTGQVIANSLIIKDVVTPTTSLTIELGNIGGSSTTPSIDFHSGATAVDYDTRLIASGGTGVSGNGTLTFYGASLTVNAALTATSIIKSGGTSSQFLKADGSVDSTTYQASLGYTPLNKAGDTLTGPLIFSTGAATASPPASNLTRVGGLGSPWAGKTYFGDGTGWKYAYSKRIASVDTDLFTIQDNGNTTTLGSSTAASFAKSGGTSSQFLKADGSVDSTTYLSSITSGNVTTALGYTPLKNVTDTFTGTLTLTQTSYINWAAGSSRGIQFPYGSVGEVYSSQGTIIGNNVYVNPADTVSNQVRYKNTHATYGHAYHHMANGIHTFYGQQASVTADAIVTPVVQATLNASGLTLGGAGVFTGAGTGLTGTAASLTAGIANAVTWTNVSSKPTTLSGYSIVATDVTSQVLTNYAVGTNTALAATDTILAAFQKIQGQINARLSAEADTLATVTARGATTSTLTSFNAGLRINGAIGTGVVNSLGIDYNVAATTIRIMSFGADAATKGSIRFDLFSSDASSSISALTLTPAAATFALPLTTSGSITLGAGGQVLSQSAGGNIQITTSAAASQWLKVGCLNANYCHYDTNATLGHYFYQLISSVGGFKLVGGTSSQFLKADGTTDSTAYQTSLGYTPINKAGDSGIGALTGTSFNAITGLASVAPLINGGATVGTSTLAARQDHIHPYDNARKIRSSLRWFFETALTTTDKQPAYYIETASTLKAIRAQCGTAGTGTVLIKKNGTTIYTVTFAGTDGTAWTNRNTGLSDSLVAGDSITAVCSVSGTALTTTLHLDIEQNVY